MPAARTLRCSTEPAQGIPSIKPGSICFSVSFQVILIHLSKTQRHCSPTTLVLKCLRVCVCVVGCGECVESGGSSSNPPLSSPQSSHTSRSAPGPEQKSRLNRRPCSWPTPALEEGGPPQATCYHGNPRPTHQGCWRWRADGPRHTGADSWASWVAGTRGWWHLQPPLSWAPWSCVSYEKRLF